LKFSAQIQPMILAPIRFCRSKDHWQLSRPICRVYDIGETDGHFLSMNLIDGETASLLSASASHERESAGYCPSTRGRPRGCAQTSAASDLASQHHARRARPVRITDFGLAIAQEDETQAAEIAGTPAYMAPEQLAGKGATVRSDMYSLGLVLYELYTGKKAFTATTLAELRQQKETHTPRAISELREGMDPVVERLIRRCMERDPNARPSSVAQLALALPGGDPLAAALAAGETPSPEMVAASGGKEGLRPAVAWGLLAFIIVGMLGIREIRSHHAAPQDPFQKLRPKLASSDPDILKQIGCLNDSDQHLWLCTTRSSEH
jgi:serine/threonine-protein kinase